MNNALLDQKELIEGYIRQRPSVHSAFSFVNIFSWKDFFVFQLEIIDENLCVFAFHPLGCFLYLPPLGKNMSQKALEVCFDRMEQANRGNGFSRIENVTEKQLAHFEGGPYILHKKNYEYCYYRRDISDLRGNDYKSQRGLYNFFTRNYDYEYVPYSSDLYEECGVLYDRWATERKANSTDDIYRHMLEENRLVHRSAIKHARALGLVGRIVKVDGQVQAYTFGYQITKDVFCVLFEVVNLAYKGLAVFMFREFCRDKVLSGYNFINCMDDFGMENVSMAKQAFKPCYLQASYAVRRKI